MVGVLTGGEMKELLAGSLHEFELVEFFEVEPLLDEEREAREFFGTRTFVVRGDEGRRLEFSVDPHTARATLLVKSSDTLVFETNVEVCHATFESAGSSRLLSLRLGQGGVLMIRMPECVVRLCEE